MVKNALEVERVSFDRESFYGYKPSQPRPIDVVIDELPHPAFVERLDELNETYQLIEDPCTHRRYEIGIVNQDKADKSLIFMPATIGSSLSTNPENAAILAQQAALDPGSARVYVGFPDILRAYELRLLASNGRFTRGNALNPVEQPFAPAFEALFALRRALESIDLYPTHVSADIGGGRLALGMMATLEANTIQAAYLNGVPGVTRVLNNGLKEIAEDIRSFKVRRTRSDDVWRVNKEVKHETIANLPRVYEGLGRRARILVNQVRVLPDLRLYNQAFNGHSEYVRDKHALLQDTVAAMARQSGTLFMDFKRQSKVHDIYYCKRFGADVMNLLVRYFESLKKTEGVEDPSWEAVKQMQDHRLVLLIQNGTQDHHSDFPLKRSAMEKYALFEK